jgi:hypothetical protein
MNRYDRRAFLAVLLLASMLPGCSQRAAALPPAPSAIHALPLKTSAAVVTGLPTASAAICTPDTAVRTAKPAAPTSESAPAAAVPLRVESQEEMLSELTDAIRQLRQPAPMDVSALDLGETPQIEIQNLYFRVLSDAPELKYAYAFSCVQNGGILTCQMDYMPYKTGAYPQDFSGLAIGSVQELIAAAQQHLGQVPTPIRITDPALTPDALNRALQQAGGGYINCTLSADATAICYSAPYGMTIGDCLSALEQTDALADSILAQTITPDMTQHEKAAALYLAVTQTVRYDHRYYSDKTNMPYASQTALGALKDHLAICGGYANAVRLLFEKAGIPCYTISGKAYRESHMWNLAQIDGVWLWFDATADRGLSDESRLRHFALETLDPAFYQWDNGQAESLTGPVR